MGKIMKGIRTDTKDLIIPSKNLFANQKATFACTATVDGMVSTRSIDIRMEYVLETRDKPLD